MLRVTVELIPFGIGKPKQLGIIEIGNMLSVSRGRSRYEVIAKDEVGRTIRFDHIFHRRSNGWPKLVLLCLKSIINIMPHFGSPPDVQAGPKRPSQPT